jgi:twitching motility protein PilT
MSLTSSAWSDAGQIPAKYTQAGAQVSPPLAWSNAPDDAVSFVLIVRDADTAIGNRTDHIITIEDPIEYLFSQNRSIVSQREVGPDTLGFHRALRSVLRQDPDVIMIGEMRDSASISTAMTAAETGHLVFATLHTNSASQTIDRVLDSFPAEQQSQATSQLAATLVAIISQRLVRRLDGGRVPAVEIMIVNAAIRNLIRERKTHQIDLVIETSSQEGMITLNRSLVSLVQKRVIALEQAELYSLNPAELRILIERA